MSSIRFALASLGVLSLLAVACGDGGGGSGGAGGAGASSSTSASGGAGGTGGEGGTGAAGGAGGAGGSSAAYEFTVIKGFDTAESCHWDAENKRWYVSNMAPGEEPDGEGWISRLDEKGNVLEAKWVEGFDAPAGLRMHNGILYVANITKMHGIDVKTGAVVENYFIPAAGLLNDPAVDPGNGYVYVTDTLNNVIYRFQAGMPGSEEAFLDTPDLMGPNGLLVDGSKLLVGSLSDFDPAHPGPFLSIDLATKAITPIGDVKGKWDGLEKLGADYLLSDNAPGRIVRVKPDGSHEVMFDLGKDHGFMPAADFGIDPVGKVLCVPNLGDSVALVKWQ
ncbi:hypothetical protein [Polyangium aurulentum]|uniref:hypothetical protein n=1 Tax=Polyangium aurulentum TaxID=2567896 RepID=UPI00197FE6AF|nr:hypothetical protein [Polyangium aurulentum]UQA59160.1 hypothetical protein E8A73_001175 [Polyangium aurulentum]